MVGDGESEGSPDRNFEQGKKEAELSHLLCIVHPAVRT
jgi:hypothetical protein